MMNVDKTVNRRDGNTLIRFMQWLGLHEFAVLASLVGVATLVVLFLKLAAMATGETLVSFDTSLILAMRTPGDLDNPIGPAWLEEMSRDLTALGSTIFLGLVTFATSTFLLLQKKWRTAIFIVLSILGGIALSFFLKFGYARPRPDIVAHQAQIFTSSFPSSHAMAAAVTFLTLGALLARSQASRRLKAYLIGSAAILTLLVGISRIYLGVHWPTDVLAGWAAGGAWALAAWVVARALQNNNILE